MSNQHRGPGLRGRDHECDLLDRLVAGARAGESQVLVLRGEAGVGKTALLDYLVQHTSGFRIVRASGAESEMELAFAGLHQLCAPMLAGLDHLPGPQRDALATAFGLGAGQPPDRFLVGLAVLSLLSDAAAQQPLLCLIDDAQWLDQISAQTLAFVARRLLAERVSMVFAVREASGNPELAGLPELVVGGLRDSDARALLDSAVAGRLDEQVRDRIVAETRGNPLALLELPRGLTAAQMAGGFMLPDALPLASQIEQSFVRRLQSLPTQTQQLLLTAAVDTTGDVPLLVRAAKLRGIDPDAAGPAETAALIELGTRVRFRHPLVRSAIYGAASQRERREVHAVLADATDPELDPDRRAWHLAHAAAGPDEDIAAELERSARRAQGRGGLAAAAAFLERAGRLTPDSGRRARRSLAAAQAHTQAGAFEAALALLTSAEDVPLEEIHRARVELLRGQIAFLSSRGGDAPLQLLKAAARLESLDLGLARVSYLEALTAAMYAGRLAQGCTPREVGEAVIAAPDAPQPPGPADLLLDGLAVLTTAGHAAAAPALKAAVKAFRGGDVSVEEATRWLWLACPAAQIRWDDESWDLLSRRHVQLAREAGALGVLPMALSQRATLEVLKGDLGAAAASIEEAGEIADATGRRLPPYAPVALAALRGRDGAAADLMETSARDLLAAGEGVGLTYVQWARAVLYNGLGRYHEALTAALEAVHDRHEFRFSAWVLVELIEAAARSGKPEHGTRALERLVQNARASGSDWALGIEARCRALLAGGDAADGLYREAIRRLGRTQLRPEAARAHLLYGEWLRRENRRVDAREQLRAAHNMFLSMGVEAFAERSYRELLATGERVRKRNVETIIELTAREAQIARLARDGLTNPEIGARLFLSPHTVEWHLGKVFAKLGIRSRGQLHAKLVDAAPA
jgi:DNA-binding CsgD family transcriptional regulator